MEIFMSTVRYIQRTCVSPEAIEINKIALPENHPRRATDLNNLAELYREQGEYETAEPLYLQAIEICIQSLGEEHPNTQTVLINYLIFLNEKNESKQSKDKYQFLCFVPEIVVSDLGW